MPRPSAEVLRQPVSRRRAAALQLGVLLGLAGLGALLVLLGTWLHRGDVAVGRHEALLQLDRVLQPGEQVLARAEVVQRHWWDHFRTTPGVLAATDRRLVHVATVPPALFHVDDDPPSFDEWSFVYDTTLAARLTTGVAGAGQGIVVRTRDGDERFGVRVAEQEGAVGVARVVEARRRERLAEIRRQQAIFDSIVALPAPPPLVHQVRAGETLYGIAAQYNLTPEVLKLMNGLTADRIVIRQELVVRRYRRINGAVVEYFGPPQ